MFTKFCRWTLSWARWIPSVFLRPVSLWSRCHALLSLFRSCQIIYPTPRPFIISWNANFNRIFVQKSGGPPTVLCSRLLLQYNRTHLPYLENVLCIRKLGTLPFKVTALLSSERSSPIFCLMEWRCCKELSVFPGSWLRFYPNPFCFFPCNMFWITSFEVCLGLPLGFLVRHSHECTQFLSVMPMRVVSICPTYVWSYSVFVRHAHESIQYLSDIRISVLSLCTSFTWGYSVFVRYAHERK
jgi:hypothetical protein